MGLIKENTDLKGFQIEKRTSMTSILYLYIDIFKIYIQLYNIISYANILYHWYIYIYNIYIFNYSCEKNKFTNQFPPEIRSFWRGFQNPQPPFGVTSSDATMTFTHKVLQISSRVTLSQAAKKKPRRSSMSSIFGCIPVPPRVGSSELSCFQKKLGTTSTITYHLQFTPV